MGPGAKMKVFDRLYQDALDRIKAHQGDPLKLTKNTHAQAVISTLMTINNPQPARSAVNAVSPDTAESLLNFDICEWGGKTCCACGAWIPPGLKVPKSPRLVKSPRPLQALGPLPAGLTGQLASAVAAS